ncbi:MAG: UvrD-helicase domain-containing protein, partial [Spirochaetaceae bacterium]|nr:UvrD-helicase domain-containing protein [Spirochaetaceae bacterium]
MPPYLAALNPEQLAAVRHEGAPLLILAGAGSGKTRVITTKIAWLVRERGFAPESILAVTFTNKAAREMRERAASVEPACERAVIRTFHSFGAWFLRRNAAAAGLDPNFTIYDDDDQATLLHGALPQYDRNECRRLVQSISRAKDYGLKPDSPDLSRAFSDPALRRVYALYQEKLRATGNVDFGDLIRLPAKLLREDEAIRRRTRQRFRVILVDEYQDSNVAQFELLKLLAGSAAAPAEGGGQGGAFAMPPPAYVCVVGDDDQSIYRFRGAEVKNILSFPEIFPGTEIVRLERNYRSYQSILDVAGDVVSRNAGRLGKNLRAERAGGKLPRLSLLEDQDEETRCCADLCKARVDSGGKWGDVAILYRTNAQSLSFEKEFPRRGIPYRIVGALRFYEREEVKDLLAYLALILNGRDEVAFKRVVNKPSRGIGDTSVEILVEAAAARDGDLLAAAAGEADKLRGRAKSGLREFLSVVKELRALLGTAAPAPAEGDALADSPPPDARDRRKAGRKPSGEGSLADVVERLARDSGLLEFHRGQDEVSGTQKASNIDELVNAATLYPASVEGLAEFLETIELDRTLTAEESTADAVTLITMHNTKGLEFPVVVATGLEQGLFPRDDDEDEELEEQRRLFYVAITRAKDELHLTACRWRRIHGRLFETLPSRFLSEIGAGKIEFAGSRAGASGARAASGGAAGGAAGGAVPRTQGYGYGAAGRQGRAAESAAGASPRSPGAPRQGSAAASPWRAGQAVYHDDYGAGVILKVTPTPSSGPLVVVRFETGKQAQ